MADMPRDCLPKPRAGEARQIGKVQQLNWPDICSHRRIGMLPPSNEWICKLLSSVLARRMRELLRNAPPHIPRPLAPLHELLTRGASLASAAAPACVRPRECPYGLEALD